MEIILDHTVGIPDDNMAWKVIWKRKSVSCLFVHWADSTWGYDELNWNWDIAQCYRKRCPKKRSAFLCQNSPPPPTVNEDSISLHAEIGDTQHRLPRLARVDAVEDVGERMPLLLESLLTSRMLAPPVRIRPLTVILMKFNARSVLGDFNISSHWHSTLLVAAARCLSHGTGTDKEHGK
jgi:hypothetical protein